jgi:hypothetical protein
MLDSMVLEMERTRQESELIIKAAVQHAESNAAASTERAKMEMNEHLKQREDEMLIAARSKIEEEWTAREDCLRREFQNVLTLELENQHVQLTSQHDAIVKQKDTVINTNEEASTRRLREMEEGHQRKVGELRQKMEVAAEEIWNEACTKFSAAADERISHYLILADEQCTARDEQISLLLEERVELQKLLSDKDVLVEKSNRKMKEIEKSSSDRSRRNQEELSGIMEEARHLARENDEMNKARQQMELNNGMLKNELSQSKIEYNALQSKCRELKEKMNSFDCEKQRYESRIGELSACRQLLDRQLEDLREENKELTTVSEGLTKRIEELGRNNEMNSDKIASLNDNVSGLQEKNHDLERKYNSAVTQINSLEQERREYSKLLEDGMKQNSRLLNEALGKSGQRSRTDQPVVVHLHGNTGGDGTSMNDRISSECNTLRSRVLQLQRENFLLENELMSIKKGRQGHQKNEIANSSGDDNVQSLLHENNSLKTILSMMRKEMETAGESNDPLGHNSSVLPADMTLEQQLYQSRSYLDLLLKTRDLNYANGHGFAGDEVAFLRSKYQELHRAADELREENQRLHRMCNGSSGRNDYDDEPTHRERELILKLEEATDEIEALLSENEKLAKISNELRFELWNSNDRFTTEKEDTKSHLTRNDVKNRFQEHEMLDAIMNDQSRSCDSEHSSPNNSRKKMHVSKVTCVGTKPPLAKAVEARPSKTLPPVRKKVDIDRKKKEIAKKKKEFAIEKAKIRNWNVKDPTTNPYL